MDKKLHLTAKAAVAADCIAVRDCATDVGWDQLAPASAGPPSDRGRADNAETWAGDRKAGLVPPYRSAPACREMASLL
jgi:hypothetical protein